MTRETLVLLIGLVGAAGCQSRRDAIDDPAMPVVVVASPLEPSSAPTPVDHRPIRQTIVIGRGQGSYVPPTSPAAPTAPTPGPTIVIQNNNANVGYGGGYGYGYGYGGGVPPVRRASTPPAAGAPPRAGGDWPRAPSFGPPMLPNPNARWP